jgi:hypothetical protein
LIDSDLFVPDSIKIKDEGEYFGNWFMLDWVVEGLAGNRKTLDMIGGSLQKVGWGKVEKIDHPNERTTPRQEELFKAAIENGLSEKDKLIRDMAELYANHFRDKLFQELDTINYLYTEHRVRDLQSAIAVYLYRYSLEELAKEDQQQLFTIFKFAHMEAEELIKSVKSWWKPEYTERHLAVQ